MSWPVVKPPWKHVRWLSWKDPNTNPWTHPPMITYLTEKRSADPSGELQALKMKIEALDATNEWEFLKRSSNPYELVFSQSDDSRIPGSLSNIRPLSRSFFKMIEILSVLDFFKRHSSPIQSAHVCEGPGGFIEALLYSASKQSIVVDNSWAMTLKPTKANIPGWKRAYSFLRKSPMVHIEYGSDDTGDILISENQEAFLNKTRESCNIFTADGGFDFSESYSTQEEEVFPLLVSSALIGLQTLAKGGDFVLKIFDTELESTLNLLAILAYCFDNWTLYKPSLSRPCNGEKYFLGRGYRSSPIWIINLFKNVRDSYVEDGKPIKSLFSSIPESLEKDIVSLKKDYLDQQVAALNYAISHKNEWNQTPMTIWKGIQEHSLQWCKQFQIPLKPRV
jgi:hypothetical protein